MNGYLAIFKKEMKSFFGVILAYVFLTVFLGSAGYLTFKRGFFEMRQAEMKVFFMAHLFLVPSLGAFITMSLWTQERKNGSIELLFSLPITVTQAVLGKFSAAWVFLGIALVLTFPMAISVCYLGEPDIGLIINGYLGSFLLGGSIIAIGCFFSALTKSHEICLVLTGVTVAILSYAGMPTTLNFLSTFLPMGFVLAIEKMSIAAHFDSILMGVLRFADISYFILLIIGWLIACIIVLDESKAK